jgi:pyruvate dehydrogenase E2 component (dihydrolipoamide acetyltransferase)
MTQPIAMPQMGVSVTEGVVTAWLAAEGDAVEAGQAVCEISTDKVETEVTAPAAGVISAIVAPVGETVPIGAPLALLDPAGGAGPPRPPIDITTAPRRMDYAAEAEAAVPARARDGRPLASPVARRLAAAHGIDLSSVAGSGARGRIRKADVLGAVAALERNGDRAEAVPTLVEPVVTPGDDRSLPRVEPGAAPAGVGPAPRGETAVAAGDGPPLPRGYEDVPHRIVATSPTRRAIAEHMVRSRHTAAHMTTEVEVDMHRVAAVRARANSRRVADGQPKLSYLPFVVRAACAALAEFPNLNATFDGDRLIQWRELNVCVAVDTEQGLLAPVIRRCGELSVAGIADRIADLSARARSRTLTPDDMRGGTFTVSNPGSAGAVSAMAIINQPQVAILGMPAIVRRPVVVADGDGEEAVAIRPMMLLALTFDHRAVDGAEATRCAVAVKRALEGWAESA